MPLALFGLGLFNLSAHAAEMPELSAAFLANNLWLLVATILVIFMNAGFAMVEAGMCRQKNAVNILAKNLFVFALAVTAYWFVGYSLMYGDAIAAGFLYFNGLFFDPGCHARADLRSWHSFQVLTSCFRLLLLEPRQQSFQASSQSA